MSLATIPGRRWSLQVQRALMVTAVMGLQWGRTTQAMEVIWRVAIDERPVWELAGLDGVGWLHHPTDATKIIEKLKFEKKSGSSICLEPKFDVDFESEVRYSTRFQNQLVFVQKSLQKGRKYPFLLITFQGCSASSRGLFFRILR